MTISIRPIKASDKTRWLELFKEYIVFYKSKLGDEQFELTWQRLNSGFNINGLVAELDDKIVGFTHYIFRPSTWEVEDFCYLEDLYTDPTVRGKGDWTTAPDNETARKLYDKVAITDRVQYKIYLNQ